MKKLIALVMTAILMVMMAVPVMAESPMGGWSVYSETDFPVSEAAANALDKAQEELIGADYRAVALIATQVVNGTNYAIVCAITPVVPDAVPSYQLVYVHESLDGACSIVEIQELNCAEELEETTGSWTVYADAEVLVPEEAADALVKAQQSLLGAEYKAVAVTATQLVSGMNYEMLCAITPVVPGAEATYAMVRVYAALDGTCTITQVTDIAVGFTAE